MNDSLEALEALMLKLVQGGIIPYYLHQLDPVEGAAHFEVPIEKGLELMENLRNRVPGYAVPTYVQEVPHERCKAALHGYST